ncbi:MAG TPA: hypothetical protein DCQ31_04090 [Bacteroidales bacterium]|nr:hypothetical protein [Bacteroidales bacterium]
MGYAKQYLNYECIDIYGAQEAVKAIRSDKWVFSNTQSLWNKETANGFLVVSAEIESRENYNRHAIVIVLESIRNFFEKSKINNPSDALKEAILQANRQLFFAAEHNFSLKGITLSVLVALIRDKQVYYAYVGNNNLFYASGQKIKRLTPGISQVEGDEHEEIPLVNSSIIDSSLKINASIDPITPENGDYFIICPKTYVYTSDDFVVNLLKDGGNLDTMAGKMLKEALEHPETEAKTFAIIKMNLLGGKGSAEDYLTHLYGGIISLIIRFITSPIALAIMAILAIILMLVIYGLL